MAHYEEFDQVVQDRLSRRLERPEALETWIDSLIDEVLGQAASLGPDLLELYAEELGHREEVAARQDERIAAQETMIAAWWEEKIGFRAFDGAIAALILLFRGAELRVAAVDGERARLHAGIRFVLDCAIEHYRRDPLLRGLPPGVRRLNDAVRERE